MSQEETDGLLVVWHKDDEFKPDNAVYMNSDHLFHTFSLMEPVIVQTQEEKDYIKAMGLMVGKEYRVFTVHDQVGVMTYKAATFISIDLTSG